MVISQNIPALNAQLNMMRATRNLAEATKRLSSGYRINSAKDDPAGLAISNKLSLQLAGLAKASDNASNGVALVQTAEGALNEVHNMLQRMRELAVQAATDALSSTDRDNILAEVKQLVDEIQGTAARTEYNGIKVLNGEGSRITEGRVQGSTDVDTDIATVLFVSEDVPPGRVEYTIDAVGEPAVLNVGALPPTPPATVATGGGMKINGIDVTISAGESYASAQASINAALSLAGITRKGNYLVSDMAGSKQEVSISGDAGFLSQFGLIPGGANGTDAKISGIELYDNSGSATPIAQSANGSMVASADGNQVSLKGMNGEVINFNIQAKAADPIVTNAASVSAAHPVGVQMNNGAGAAYSAAAGDPSDAAGEDMVFEFKDYGPIKIQVGGSYNNNVSVYIPKVSAETLGLMEYVGGQAHDLLNYCTLNSAANAITQTDGAIAMVSTIRSRLGAFVNRLESTVRSLDVASENTESSRSRIRDTDVAKEMTQYAQMNVMYQAGIAILTQANQRPSQVLQMLQ